MAGLGEALREKSVRVDRERARQWGICLSQAEETGRLFCSGVKLSESCCQGPRNWLQPGRGAESSSPGARKKGTIMLITDTKRQRKGLYRFPEFIY